MSVLDGMDPMQMTGVLLAAVLKRERYRLGDSFVIAEEDLAAAVKSPHMVMFTRTEAGVRLAIVTPDEGKRQISAMQAEVAMRNAAASGDEHARATLQQVCTLCKAPHWQHSPEQWNYCQERVGQMKPVCPVGQA